MLHQSSSPLSAPRFRPPRGVRNCRPFHRLTTCNETSKSHSCGSWSWCHWKSYCVAVCLTVDLNWQSCCVNFLSKLKPVPGSNTAYWIIEYEIEQHGRSTWAFVLFGTNIIQYFSALWKYDKCSLSRASVQGSILLEIKVTSQSNWLEIKQVKVRFPSMTIYDARQNKMTFFSFLKLYLCMLCQVIILMRNILQVVCCVLHF